VLKIDWPGYEKPAEMPNFESLARRQRFRVLGKACRHLRINSLLLAHHEDDQAETVMMRLVTGHGILGLRGIKSSSDIPECHGLYGVHESGGFDTPTEGEYHSRKCSSQPRIFQPACDFPHSSSPITKFSRQLVTELGGIAVYRPLLGFSKARLIATCQLEKMKWFEDHTNTDPTLTTRNAIRHIYHSYTLPNALTKPALLALSRKSKEKASLLFDEATSWLLKCSISHFETRTGIVGVQFADMNELSVSSGTYPPKYARQVAAVLLQRIVKLVTPEEHVPLSSLHGAIERVFPELFLYQAPQPPPTSFTAAGVRFQPVDTPPPKERHSTAISHETKYSSKCQWLISRQPYISKRSKRPVVVVPFTNQESTADSWSPWSLYDGRFWIRIENRSLRSLYVRPFCKDDLMSFRRSLPKIDREDLRWLLKNIAPGDVRWTLPAIVLREVDGNERVLALPTLDIRIPEVENLVRWEVKYKKVNTGGMRVAEPQLINEVL
jgi:tRNA(Ile)-lysidine synthase